MNEKQLYSLFHVWQQRLGLGSWDIEVRVAPCSSKHSFMECQRARAYQEAVMLVQPWVLTGEIPEQVMSHTLTDKRIECKVVHELLHCNLYRMRTIIQDTLDGQLHRDVYTVMDETFGNAEEDAIESLALALVKAWPS